MTKSVDVILMILVLYISVTAFLMSRPEDTWAERSHSVKKIKNWLCYYSNRFGPEVYTQFDLAVFDGVHHPPLKKKKNGKPFLLGYVTIGEVDRDGTLWPSAKDKPFLIDTNDFWDSWIVDVRHPEWHRMLFEEAIPAVLERGFDGLFLDTFDSPLGLLKGKNAGKHEGIDMALIDIARRIRKEYPDKFIAVNRGLPVLPAIAKVIDFIVVEDLYSYYNEKEKAYVRVDPNTRNILLSQVEAGLRENPDLTVLTLDYAEVHQAEMIKEAIVFSKKKEGLFPMSAPTAWMRSSIIP